MADEKTARNIDELLNAAVDQNFNEKMARAVIVKFNAEMRRLGATIALSSTGTVKLTSLAPLDA
jgi:hypothetical protein